MKDIIKLGEMVKDSVTGLKGMATHMMIQIGLGRHYCFQPRGINPEDGQPVPRLWVPDGRLQGKEVPCPDLPVSVLGTEVEDEASGFCGKAVSLTLHISGCVHVEVQPVDTIKKTGALINSADFDIRRLKGEAIPKITDQERDLDQKKRPSPAECPRLYR